MAIENPGTNADVEFRLIPRAAAPSLRPVIRFLLTTLTALCLLAGQSARASLADGCRAGETDDNCHQTHLATTSPDDGHHPGDDCPVDHHCQHGCCVHGHSLEAGQPMAARIGLSKNARGGVRHEDEAPPEGPFLSGEKPPLI